MLLAYKVNEPHLAVDDSENSDMQAYVEGDVEGGGGKKKKKKKHSLMDITKVKVTKKSNNSLSLLIDFLAQNWKLNPKDLFSAEWGVFVALEFKTHASPTVISFHFKRLMRSLERDPAKYLGKTMWNAWVSALKSDKASIARRERRKQKKKARSEKRIMNLEKKMGIKKKRIED